MDELTKHRRATRAKEIAREVDMQAGGYFRGCLERAALLGMEFTNPAADENTPTVAKTLGEKSP